MFELEKRQFPQQAACFSNHYGFTLAILSPQPSYANNPYPFFRAILNSTRPRNIVLSPPGGLSSLNPLLLPSGCFSLRTFSLLTFIKDSVGKFSGPDKFLEGSSQIVPHLYSQKKMQAEFFLVTDNCLLNGLTENKCLRRFNNHYGC